MERLISIIGNVIIDDLTFVWLVCTARGWGEAGGCGQSRPTIEMLLEEGGAGDRLKGK